MCVCVCVCVIVQGAVSFRSPRTGGGTNPVIIEAEEEVDHGDHHDHDASDHAHSDSSAESAGDGTDTVGEESTEPDTEGEDKLTKRPKMVGCHPGHTYSK